MATNEFLRDLNGELQSTSQNADIVIRGNEEAGAGLGWKEKGGKGLNGLENLVAVMFDADRKSLFPSPLNPIPAPLLRFRQAVEN